MASQTERINPFASRSSDKFVGEHSLGSKFTQLIQLAKLERETYADPGINTSQQEELAKVYSRDNGFPLRLGLDRDRSNISELTTYNGGGVFQSGGLSARIPDTIVYQGQSIDQKSRQPSDQFYLIEIPEVKMSVILPPIDRMGTDWQRFDGAELRLATPEPDNPDKYHNPVMGSTYEVSLEYLQLLRNKPPQKLIP